ncbi:hypothetical protein [Streptomyces sioyaensis]|uniref:hypothetical protein n=1 Tax=Streptomyces sioyaensis TaxID=67364 RepID=UPI003D7561B2
MPPTSRPRKTHRSSRWVFVVPGSVGGVDAVDAVDAMDEVDEVDAVDTAAAVDTADIPKSIVARILTDLT